MYKIFFLPELTIESVDLVNDPIALPLSSFTFRITFLHNLNISNKLSMLFYVFQIFGEFNGWIWSS